MLHRKLLTFDMSSRSILPICQFTTHVTERHDDYERSCLMIKFYVNRGLEVPASFATVPLNAVISSADLTSTIRCYLVIKIITGSKSYGGILR